MRPLEIVKHHAAQVHNGATKSDIHNHLQLESAELKHEIILEKYGDPCGADGIIGEATDVIACALHLILETNPNFTDDQFEELLTKKCEKWVKHYAHSLTKA